MGYLDCALWLVIAIYMTYLAFKESKFFFVLSGFFLFMSVWYLLNKLLPDVDMFSGIYSWIFISVAVLVLAVCLIVYIRYRKAISAIEKEQKKDE